MRYLVLILLVLIAVPLRAQEAGPLTGEVTFITPANVYVRFSETGNISAGDTLFIEKEGKYIPAITVTNLSSRSCVGTPFPGIVLNKGDKIFFLKKMETILPQETQSPGSPEIKPAPVIPVATDTVLPVISRVQNIRGFVSVASYSNWSSSADNSQKEKLTLSFNGRNLGNSPYSAEVYISYVHNPSYQPEIPDNIFNSLKIYNLNVTGDYNKIRLMLGRKINPKLSSMGANDGLQFEVMLKPVSFGIIAGFRPDYNTYGFNSSLFQFGGYVYHEMAGKRGIMQSTVAFINQTNSFKTDRRYIYLQHVNSLIKNFTFFGSADIDIYGMKFSEADSTYKGITTIDLTNLYLSLGYRIGKKAYLSLSYNSRRNLIYYETYKSLLDRLLDFETFRGLMFHGNYNITGRFSVGLTASYRLRENDPKPATNIYGYASYLIPVAGITATGSVLALGTSYNNGMLYGIGLSKDFLRGKLYMSMNYRYADYKYVNTELDPILQNIGEFNLTLKIIKTLALSAYYEGTFEKSSSYNRVYLQLNWSFR